jgi:general secretion pathway protein A
MYSDYWNLTKSAFDNVPDSSMYVDCHVSMEDVIAETIYAIKEGNECLTVIVGEVGLGKTLSLRVIIDSLEPEKYKVALITNPALSFIQLLREIIGQITGKQCVEKKKVDLLEMFNHLLFETADQGKKIVIVIDEANVLSSSNLDDLRLLTNMQDDERNLFTLLLAGQMELAHRLEQPKRANLFQRIGTYGHLEKLPSKEAVKDYIESRLKIAGTQKKIFTDDAIPVIWEFSEHGVPRLINKICKLCLKAGETNEFETISSEVASQIADRFQKLSKTRKAPNRSEAEPSEKGIEEPETERVPKIPRVSVPREEAPKVTVPARPIPPQREEPVRVQQREVIPEPPPIAPPPREEVRPVQPRTVISGEPPVRPVPPQREEPVHVQQKEVIPEPPFSKPIPPQWEEPVHVQQKEVIPEPPPSKPIPPQWEEPVHVQQKEVIPEPPPSRPIPPQREEPVRVQPKEVMPEQPSVRPLPSQWQEARPVEPGVVIPETPSARPISPQREEAVRVEPKTVPLAKPAAYVPIKGAPLAKTSVTPVTPQQEIKPVETKQQEEMKEQPAQADQEDYEEVLISKQKVKLTIPTNVIKQAQAANSESKNKLAGYWSAQIVKANPHLMNSPLADPVSIWFDVKNVILKRFNSVADK